MRLIMVAGARPNFMKVAPIVEALRKHNRSAASPVAIFLVHTGQHYDEAMSESFFVDLGIPQPDVNLGVGSGSHATQTAEVMKRFEPICLEYRPTHVLVVGDVNSTIACALVATKLGPKVVHVEAGLRSFDRSMPEEINRVLTDAISDVHFITEESGRANLLREGVSSERVHFVGNVMVDTLLRHRDKAAASDILERVGVADGRDPGFGVLTLHRPSNVDARDTLGAVLEAVREIAERMPVLFPVHPRTLQRIKEFGLNRVFAAIGGQVARVVKGGTGLYGLPPLGYLDFLQLMANARVVLTDSGGIQEETTILRIACVTIRENTERPVTITHGTNRLAGTNPGALVRATQEALNARYDGLSAPPYWDGKAAERIVQVLCAGSCAAS